LLLAYKEAKKEGMTSNLVIVGNQNNFKTKDEEVIEILENSKNEGIEFTGYVDNKELKKLIAEAKVLVQPSLYEGFGIPPLEALALGTPAIVSDIDVFKELYIDLNIKFFEVNNWKNLKNIFLKDFFKNKMQFNNIKYNYKECFFKIEEAINEG
ncbi:MAG: glycosyltransferase, partial [Cetobacterium sp.]|uniref:glycosyltransferase n=1 Tax=Cetobacterium sp. TaxID=2071632 RepID=UPI003F2FA29C